MEILHLLANSLPVSVQKGVNILTIKYAWSSMFKYFLPEFVVSDVESIMQWASLSRYVWMDSRIMYCMSTIQ